MKKFSKIYLALLIIFLYVPIFVLIVYSFNVSKSKTVFSGFTFDWYLRLFNNRLIMTSLVNTLIIAVIASIVSTILGTAAAIGFSKMKKIPRALAMQVNNIPIINPEIVTGVSLMLLFVFFSIRMNFEMGMGTLIIAHITFDVPYVILNVMPKFRQMNPHIYEAAQDLGCNPFKAFFKVVLPEIMPGVISGFLMSFAYSLDDFVISLFTSGQTQTLPITIYTMTRKRITPEINALSTLIFIVVVTILVIKNVLENRDLKKKTAELSANVKLERM